MKLKTYAALSFFLVLCAPLKGSWQPSVTNYTRHTYKAGNQNWGLEQHENGWMYVANTNGLLEFDGTDWSLYPLKRNAKVRAMKIGDDGRIYIGGIGQFGYFTPNSLGGVDYTCLSDSLPRNVSIGVIWNILQDKNRIYFQSDRKLFYSENNHLEYLDYDGEIYTSAILYNKFYIGATEGLLVLKGKHFTLIPGSEGLGRIASLLPYNGKVLIVTRYNGLFIYDGSSVKKYASGADDFMKQNHVFCAALNKSLLAIGSVQNGVCLLDLEKNNLDVISISNGLQNKTVLSIAFDAQENIWLGLDNGIDHIHLNSRVVSLYGNKPVIGSGYSSCLYDGKLYMGTNQGVYCTLPPVNLNRVIPMDFISGTGGQIWSFLSYDDKLFCASDNGVFVIDRGKVEHLEGLRGVRLLVSLNHRPDVLIAATYGKYSGLYLLEKEAGRWKVTGRLKNFTYAAKSLLAESAGNVLWVTNKDRGICRLKLSDDLQEVVSIKRYNNSSFPSGYDIHLAQISNEIVVVSHYGLWQYSQVTDSLEEYSELELLLDGKTSYTYLTTDVTHNIWYVTGGVLKLLRYDAVKNTYYKNPHESFLKGSLIENNESVNVCGNQAVVGTEEGFSLVSLSSAATSTAPLSLQIRRVYLTGKRDSLIYGRSYQYDDSPVIIPYKRNSLRIQYNVNTCDPSQVASYSFRLSSDSDKGEWSEYSENNVKEFTGLHEGKYVFSVKLMTDKDEEPVITDFDFEILPPWYRTWWSYLISVVLLGALLYYICYYIADSRKRLVMQKEQEFYHQKQELQKESDLKDKKINILKEENLQSELRHKSEELIRTTLNIVRKNEILLEIKKEVLGISHSISEENIVSLRRKTLRLLGHIDTNIEHDNDLQVFQNTFDSVHHNFFRKLEEAYPELNNKEKMLCAYIKMNLLSKEIAPLLNISLRGVEISRYRLRKKLDMEEGGNLAEFLQKFSR